MDYETLIKLIDMMGGDDFVLGFVFDNSGSKCYTNENPFKRATHLNAEVQCLFDFDDVDTGNNRLTGVKPLSTIQSVLFTDTTKDKNKYNTRYLCG